MAILDIFPAKVNSPPTKLTYGINDTDTTVYVDELNVFPDAPNEATIGKGILAETVKYTYKSASSGAGYLTIERAFQGIAASWPAGTEIARKYTAYDYDAMCNNLTEHNHKLDDLTAPDDNTDLNASTSAHGLLPKLPNDDDKVLDGTGSWVDSDALPSISAPTRTIWLSAGAGMPNTTDGCEAWAQTELETNDIQIGYLEYPTAVGRSAQWLFAMPDNYDGGTITAKFYWTFSSGSGDVMWGIYGRAFDDDEALDQSLGSGVTVTDTGLSANDLHKTAATSALTLGGTPSGGDLVIIQIARLGQEESDTHGGSALLLGVKLEYTTNTYSD